MTEVFWTVGWPQIITIIAAFLGGIVMAIIAYPTLHDDLRNMDGTRLSGRETTRHILSLLAYFVLGVLIFGGGCALAFYIAE